MEKLNIAIIGAGIFTKDTYLPLIKYITSNLHINMILEGILKKYN